MNDVQTWLASVLGDGPGWIDLRAIHPDAAAPPIRETVQTVQEAAAWCKRLEFEERNLYAGLCRRGNDRDDKGHIAGSESNLLSCRVLWADLDDGTREEQLAHVAGFPIRPSMTVDSGGGIHALWLFEEPLDVSTPEMRARIRHILKGIQLNIGGDPAVTDPSRIFRIAGTRNYPNARKRALGRTPRFSSILECSPYSVALDDFDDHEIRGATELSVHARPAAVHAHGESLPSAVELILSRVPRMESVFFCRERLKDKSASDEDFAIAVGVLRRAPWLADDLIAAALRYRRIGLAHLVRGAEKTQGYYASTVARARDRLDDSPVDFEIDSARWFRSVLSRALEPQPAPRIVAEPEHYEMPRLATSIESLDEALGGGAYGFTAIVGDSGVGKSTVALNASLIARQAGWTVLYVAAEMEAAEYEVRAGRYLGLSVAEVRESKALPVIAEVSDGLSVDSLAELVLTTVTEDTQRYLVVLDSLTKIAAFLADEKDPGGFFGSLAKLTRMAESSVRYGERRILFIATSELNKDREALGRRLTYSASAQVNMMQDKEQPDLVKISVAKGRHSAKTGEMGPYMHRWRSHRLDLIGSLESVDTEERYA